MKLLIEKPVSLRSLIDGCEIAWGNNRKIKIIPNSCGNYHELVEQLDKRTIIYDVDKSKNPPEKYIGCYTIDFRKMKVKNDLRVNS